jgi:hypothetical protein
MLWSAWPVGGARFICNTDLMLPNLAERERGSNVSYWPIARATAAARHGRLLGNTCRARGALVQRPSTQAVRKLDLIWS